mgnify:CR=1 FL=1
MSHMKRLLATLAIVFLLNVPIQAQAAEQINIPEGFVIGDNQGISVTQDGGYFFNLDGLLPGDTITRDLIIQNTRNSDYSLKMIIEPVSSIGPVNLLEKMAMTFHYDGQALFDGNLVNDNGSTTESKEVDFGTIQAGSTHTIQIKLKVKSDIPWEEFQAGESKAVTRWTFIAQSPEEPSDSSSSSEPVDSSSSVPVDPSSSSTVAKPTGSYPSTGDKPSSMLFLASGLMMMITAILFFLLNRKEKEDPSTPEK